MFEGRQYPSVEHAYQAAKTLDQVERVNIGSQSTPSAAKRQGRLSTVRDNWEDIKLGVMEVLLMSKFGDNEFFKKKLLDTFPAQLIENNWWNDRYWGVCNGDGANHLGNLLMDIRDRIVWLELRKIGFNKEAINIFLDSNKDVACKTI